MPLANYSLTQATRDHINFFGKLLPHLSTLKLRTSSCDFDKNENESRNCPQILKVYYNQTTDSLVL